MLVDEHHLLTFYNWLQYYDPGDLNNECGESAFHVAKFYSDITGNTFDPQVGEFVIAARKP